MQQSILLILVVILASCASTMPGSELSTGSDRVSATIAINSTLSNERIQTHQFSIKNNTNEWLEFDGAKMTGGKGVEVLVGERISAWTEACTLEKKVSDYNLNLFLGSMAVAGAAVAGGSQHQQTATTGAVIALGSITAMGVRDYQRSKHKAEFQKAFPEKHIFQPFVVPPKKVIQRWIMVENPSRVAFQLDLQNKSGEKISLKIEGKQEKQIEENKKDKKNSFKNRF